MKILTLGCYAFIPRSVTSHYEGGHVDKFNLYISQLIIYFYFRTQFMYIYRLIDFQY